MGEVVTAAILRPGLIAAAMIVREVATEPAMKMLTGAEALQIVAEAIERAAREGREGRDGG